MKEKFKLKDKTKSFIIIFLVFALIVTSLSAFIVTLEDKYQNDKFFTFKNTSFTKQEYSVFYSLYINEFVNEYGMYLSYWGLDVNKDFAKQQYDEEHTWEDVLKTNMEKDLKQYIVLNEDIEDKNEKVDVKDNVNSLMEIFKANAKTDGSEYKDYLQAVFGEGVTEKDVRKAVDFKYKAIEYSSTLYKKFYDEPTDKDLISLYTDYPAAFDKILYRSLLFDIEEHDEAHEFEENITNEDSFIKMAKEYTKDDTLQINVGTRDLNSDEMISWLYDDSRKLGDKTLIETEDGYYVIFFKSRKLCDDKTASFRHIYFNTIGANEDELKEIRSKANAVYSTITTSEDPVKEFDDSIVIYSDDSTTKLKNGKVENVRDGSLDSDINDWLFDKNRKQNDMVLKETSSGIYIFCFDSFGEVYWKVFGRQYLAETNYDNYVAELMGDDAEANDNTSTTSLENNNVTSTDVVDEANNVENVQTDTNESETVQIDKAKDANIDVDSADEISENNDTENVEDADTKSDTNNQVESATDKTE